MSTYHLYLLAKNFSIVNIIIPINFISNTHIKLRKYILFEPSNCLVTAFHLEDMIQLSETEIHQKKKKKKVKLKEMGAGAGVQVFIGNEPRSELMKHETVRRQGTDS